MKPLELVTRSAARGITYSQLVGLETGADQHTLDCAALRGVIWSLSRGGEESVHVLRVLNSAAQLALDEELETPDVVALRRERLRSALDDLLEVKDLIELPNGRWLPSVPRIVLRGGDVADGMLVGGLPSSLLPSDLRKVVRHQGAVRRCEGEVIRRTLDLPSESIETWMDEPRRPLKEWVSAVMSGAQLEPYQLVSETQQLLVYAPLLAAPGAHQYFRWRDCAEGTPAGRYLAKREGTFGGALYRVVEVVAGNVTKAGVPMLVDGDARRLMYGIDLIAGRPTSVRAGERDGYFRLELGSEVPGPERRLFAAFGKVSMPEGRSYPRSWTFRSQDRQLIEQRLKGLGVQTLPLPLPAPPTHAATLSGSNPKMSTKKTNGKGHARTGRKAGRR